MKTTVAITKEKRLVVFPNKTGGITLCTGQDNELMFLTPDQAGALIFALEQAAEAAQISQHRAASVAHGVDL